ncbi:MAG: NADH-quinone oxidoreductase subunit NuoE [Candidatus Aminicenantes bacterium]|nr:NADH-quinone oxidoreductase subunit NuoE [Candidatus Aminicenantes bacterium]
MSGPLSDALRAGIAGLAERYPTREAALLPALHRIQEEMGWIPPAAEVEVAGMLGLRPIQVREAVTFYTMFRRRPSGRHHLQVCRNLSCTLRGGDVLLDHLRARLGIVPGETTPDGRFTLSVVECLGNCENSPCLMIDFEEHGRLDLEAVDGLLEGLD